MNETEYSDHALKNADFLFMGGSHAYGTNHKDSDLDVRGCFKGPANVLSAPFQDYPRDIVIVKEHEDTVLWEMGTFMRKAPRSPEMIDGLFVPKSGILLSVYGRPTMASERYWMLRKNRDAFISKSIVSSLMGHVNRDINVLGKQRLLFEKGIEKPSQIDFLYMDDGLSQSFSEAFRMIGGTGLCLRNLEASEKVQQKKSEVTVYALMADDGSELLNAQGHIMPLKSTDRYRGLHLGLVFYDAGAYKRANNTYKSRINSPGKSSIRSEREKQFGFDTKTAANALREARMALEISKYGEYLVARDDADELRAIILDGARGLEDIVAEILSLLDQAKTFLSTSTLPEAVDKNRLTDLYYQACDMPNNAI
jgi:hypothetical protein